MLRPQIAEVLIRGRTSKEDLAHAVSAALGRMTADIRPAGGSGLEGEAERTRLREVFEKSPAIIATFRGPDHVCEMANPQYLSLIGDREAIGTPVREVVPEVEGQGYFELMDEAYEAGIPVGGEERSLQIQTTPDGPVEQRYVNFVYQPLREEGEVVGLVAHGVDVTEQVRSRERIEQSERRLRHVLHTIADGVLLTDESGEIIYANPAAERIFAGDAPTIVGCQCTDLPWEVRTLDGETMPPDEWPVPRVLASGEAVEAATFVMPRTDREDLIASARAAPMLGEDGKMVGVVASVRDVTEEHRIQDELGTARRLLDGVVESVPDTLYAKDRDGRYLIINSAGAEMFGLSVDDVVGDTDELLFTPSDAASIRNEDCRVMELGRPLRFEEQVRTVGGEERHFDVAKAPLRREDGAVAGVVGITRDVTERRRAEQALERSEEKYAKLFQATPLGIALSTREGGRFLEVNEGFERLLGYAREELIEYRAPNLDIWVDAADRDRLVSSIREEGAARGIDARLRRKDGQVIEAEIFGEAIEVEGTPCIITVTRDVTEQRRNQRELAESREKLRRYAAHLTSARERERTELARDIHDQLGQLLTAIKLKTSKLARASEGNELGPVAFEEVTKLIDQAVADVRDLSTSLRPSALDQFGLVDAIRWQADRFADRFDIAVSVEAEGEEIRLGDDRDIHVFRVVQEALTNVGRHAEANRIVVRLDGGADELTVRILDDGKGVDPPSAKASDSHGLLGMEERAHVLGGEFSLEDRPEGGAEARLTVPRSGGGRA